MTTRSNRRGPGNPRNDQSGCVGAGERGLILVAGGLAPLEDRRLADHDGERTGMLVEPTVTCIAGIPVERRGSLYIPKGTDVDPSPVASEEHLWFEEWKAG